ncbi:hypothetical protein Tco_0955301 [Tanacetum coccineum]|uniref:Uncharacterized protein n=1 Tax=Tanacetum coccineum TaxID=301880 RepID=A0ABQ5E6X1_9ASTR
MANKHSIMTREMVESFCNSYYIPDEVHPTAPGRDRTITQFPEDMGLLDYIRTADPRKVQAVEVQKGEKQVKLLDSIKHCFVSLDTPVVAQQEGGSGSGAGPEVSVPAAEENVDAEENIVPAGTYLDLTDPEDDLIVAEKGDATRKQPKKAKRKKLSKQNDTLPAKRLRADVHAQVTVRSSSVADAPVYTAADTVTSSRGKTHVAPTSDVGGSSQLETSEGSADSFYETAALNYEDAKRWSSIGAARQFPERSRPETTYGSKSYRSFTETLFFTTKRQ